MSSWYLADATEIASKKKYTFYKPSDQLIKKLEPSEHVQLIFGNRNALPGMPCAERMWVIIDSIDDAGNFTGRLDNVPMSIKDLRLGEKIHFTSAHIIKTMHADPDALPDKYCLKCVVTRKVIDGASIGFISRLEPDLPDDSGWLIAAGSETPEYLADIENVAYVSLGAVLNLDDSILGILDAPLGSVFRRDSQNTTKWVMAESL